MESICGGEVRQKLRQDLKLVRCVALLLGTTTAAVLLLGQGPGSNPVPHDWSHHHMIFSQPATALAARVQSDPRFWHQWYSKYVPLLQWGGPVLNSQEGIHRDWGEDLGSGAKVGAGVYPAKFGFNIASASCTNDFVVFNTSLAGTSGQASVVAYNNLYSSCTGSPSVYWAYNTSGTISTSVALSLDGTQVAFVHTNPSGASLVLLKWHANPSNGTVTNGTVTAPKAPTSVAASAYRGCTAPCMAVMPFAQVGSPAASPNDTLSSPYYVYGGADTMYVGDDTGYLHKFTGVFSGTPLEGTPVQLAVTKLSSPVYDSVSNTVFATTAYDGGSNGGRLQAMNASTNAVTSSLQLGPTGTAASSCSANGTVTSAFNLDAPIVDSSAQKVYVFIGNDGPGTNNGHRTTGNSAVYEFATNFASHTCGTEVTVGVSSTTPLPLYIGAFDNQYFSSANSSTPTGHIYVCGNTGGNATLYQVPVTNGTIGSSKAGPVLTSATTTCSSVSEIYNASASGGPFDWIFLGVQASGSPSACVHGGCVMNFIVTSWQANTTYTSGQAVLDSNLNIQKVTTAGKSGGSQPTWRTTGTTTDGAVTWTYQGAMGASSATLPATGGVSGIVVDNAVSTITGTSQIYYSTLGNQGCTGGTGGCAIQASQALLK
jgi:hypothetical protein